jgi:esterase
MTTKQPLLNFQQRGTGRHLVLIHGLFGSLENLNMVAKPLSESYCVTSIDVRNHGESFHNPDMSYDVLARDIINVLDYLDINNCFLLGHSMGGKIAIQVALTEPQRIAKLIVADIAPVQYPPHHLKIIEGLQSIDLAKVQKRKDADIQLAHYVDNIGVRQFLLRNLAINEQGAYAFKCSIKDIASGYSEIMKANELSAGKQPYNGPCLFIKGGASDYILPQYSELIKKLLPDSKAKIIQGAGHWLHAEKSIAFNKVVSEFIA